MSLRGKINVLEQKILQKRDYINGINAQIDSLDSQVKLLEEQLDGSSELLKQGLEIKSKV